ncbi:MAG: glycosyltransferase family 9 protein [Endomicrobiales bacterium]|nr:glycosyltransferase family 9 protein [Endomicrobiales bacterium]
MRGNKLLRYLDFLFGSLLIFSLGVFISKKPKNLLKTPKKILVIKLSAVGDSILLYPALRSLRQKFNTSKIFFLGTQINKETLETCPFIDEFIELNLKSGLLSLLNFIVKFKKEKIELSIDFEQWTRLTPLISYFLGIRNRVGFITAGQHRHYLFTQPLLHKENIHEVDCFNELASSLGAINLNTNLEFFVKPDSIIKAKQLLSTFGIKENDTFIILHPETPLHGIQRRWPVENYAKLANIISENFDVKILISGKTQEPEIINVFKDTKCKCMFLPALSLNEIAAVIKYASLIVCGNTGLMHLASALHTPTIALHGPTNPIKWGPIGDNAVAIKSKLNCSPCLSLGFEYGCKRDDCMRSINVTEVFEFVKQVLQKLI